jgi:hypothetical protein
MTGSIIGQNSPLRTIPLPKSKLLLVADSPDRLKKMKNEVRVADFEITGVCSVDELRVACRNHHDLAVLDVEAVQVKPMLSALRSSAAHKTIMALVESSRLSEDQNLAGLLPTFRAMPCNQAQMAALMRQFGENGKRSSDKRPVLL